jgi:hypothetical protein
LARALIRFHAYRIDRAGCILRWKGIILGSCLAKPVQGGLREAQAPKTSGKDQEKRGVARCGQVEWLNGVSLEHMNASADSLLTSCSASCKVIIKAGRPRDLNKGANPKLGSVSIRHSFLKAVWL